MAISEKWVAGGTLDISFGDTAWHKTVKVPKKTDLTAEFSYGDYVAKYWISEDNQTELIDLSYAYCAADSNFAMQKGVLYNCGYSGYAANRNKKYILSNDGEMSIGLAHLNDFSTYSNFGIYGGDRSSNKKQDTENTPLTDYLNGYYARQAGKVYGGGFVPFVGGYNFKDIVAVPIIMSYRLASGKNPAEATVSEMQSLYYRLSTIDAFFNKEYITFPYVMGVYIAFVNVNTDTKTMRVSNNQPKVLPMINGSWTIDIDVVDEGTQSIKYYPIYGDDNSNNETLDGWYAWDGTESVWQRKSLHPFRVMGYCGNQNEWKQPLIRIDGLSPNYSSTGKLIITGDWIHTDLVTVSATEHWVKIYSDAITSANVASFCEYVRKQAAYLGCFFNCNGYVDAMDYRFIDDNTYMGIIDSSGITHGEYTQGINNTKNQQYDWSDVINDTPYKPGGGGEEEPGTVTGDGLNRYINAVTGFGIGKKHYAVTDTELAALNQYIYDMSDFKAVCRRWVSRGGSLASLENEYGDDAGYKAAFYTRAGFGEYPTNNYISLLAFPFDIPGAYLTDSGFILGTADTSQPYYPDVSERYDITPDTKPTTKAITTNSGIITLDLGSTTIKHPVYKDFRAYEPYTRIELAVPYHGTIELQASEWLNHNLSIEIDVDLSSGASYAYVLCDGIPQYALAGTMGVSVPLTVQSSSDNNISLNDMSIQSAAQKTALKYGIINAGIDVLDQAVTAAMTDNVEFTRSIKTGLNVSQQIEQTALSQRAINYKVQHTADGRSIIGTSAPAIQFTSENQCRLTIHYPNMLQYNNSVYASTVGYACNRQGLLSSFSGYTVCSNINITGIACTDAEATLIIQQMQSGIIL